MTTERPSPEVLEAWIKRSWDARPPFRYDVFVEMYQDEQEVRAKADAADWRTKEVVALRQRVATLERILGPRGKRLAGDLIAGIGKALAEIREQDRARILGEIEARGFVTYGGVWDETVEYPRGALVTHGGSAWVALTPAEKGLKPGKAPAWRLAAKGESTRAPVTV